MDPTVPPQPVPILPTPTQEPPVSMENHTQQDYAFVPPVINETPKRFPIKWIILGSLLLLALIISGIFFYFQRKAKTPSFQSDSNDQYTYTPIVVPTDTPLPITIAPPGTSEFRRQYYRTRRATVAEAQVIDKEVGPIFGSLAIPSDLKFEHEEVYKGIPIKWTSGQPILPERLAWIKAGINLLPPFFAVDHPITGIISATIDELKITDGLNKSRLGIAAAFASGLNIFVTNNLLLDKPGYVPLKEKEMISTLFHEWTHVVQYYEALQTFSEVYLKMPGNAIVATSLTPFIKDFAKSVGWDFGDPQYEEENNFGRLKTDAESQKTSDYGKTYFHEDMAETAASFLTCQTSSYSEARIKWTEKVTNTSASSYCR